MRKSRKQRMNASGGLIGLISLVLVLAGVGKLLSGQYGWGSTIGCIGLGILLLNQKNGKPRTQRTRKVASPSRKRSPSALPKQPITVDTMGIPASQIFGTRKKKQLLRKAAVAAANRIRDIPVEYVGNAASTEYVRSLPISNYLDKVVAVMIAAVKQEPLPEGRPLPEQMIAIFNNSISPEHARFIACDQLHKITSTIDEAEQRELGVKQYIWRTAKDERVVGTPGGLYPAPNDPERQRIHGNHFEREGKIFAWNDPPPDGHPGQSCGCRCYAEAVLDVDAILDL